VRIAESGHTTDRYRTSPTNPYNVIDSLGDGSHERPPFSHRRVGRVVLIFEIVLDGFRRHDGQRVIVSVVALPQ
jgi:hypothetical protein